MQAKWVQVCLCCLTGRLSLNAQWMPTAILRSGCSAWLMACRTLSSR